MVGKWLKVADRSTAATATFARRVTARHFPKGDPPPPGDQLALGVAGGIEMREEKV